MSCGFVTGHQVAKYFAFNFKRPTGRSMRPLANYRLKHHGNEICDKTGYPSHLHEIERIGLD